jgi:hypothetical protein
MKSLPKSDRPNPATGISPQPKSAERANIPLDAEIESIKRTLYNAIDKLERIKRRDAELITT